ncbi:hypothetical protein CASFOL_020493 [Castilleja foliolosa]|uniref:Uncharacterized protein n=1 Tax=Castilleja foliolosa TaxID=1961234 RepID=A0ABD3D105_9LAMI
MPRKIINTNKYDDVFEDVLYKGMGIHSQVRKIKQEMEKINRLAVQLQPEARPAVKVIGSRRERSRSPLGLAERPIPVGN